MSSSHGFLRRNLPVALFVSLALGGATVGAIAWLDRPRAPAAEDEESDPSASHAASGRIKAFGPDRAYAQIAHDDIPGYMAAMTMAFEFADTHMADELVEGDKVRFSFKADRKGRLVIVSIAKDDGSAKADPPSVGDDSGR